MVTWLLCSLMLQQPLQSASSSGPCNVQAKLSRGEGLRRVCVAEHALRTEMPTREFARSMAPPRTNSAATYQTASTATEYGGHPGPNHKAGTGVSAAMHTFLQQCTHPCTAR